MNTSAAIHAHLYWRARLATYLDEPDGTLDPEVVSSPHHCELGRWLDECGREDVEELRALHEQFHAEAAELVRRADAGESVAPEAAFGAFSPYGITSSSLVAQLQGLAIRLRAA